MNKLMKSRSVKRVATGGLVAAAALGIATVTAASSPGTAGATTSVVSPVPNLIVAPAGREPRRDAVPRRDDERRRVPRHSLQQRQLAGLGGPSQPGPVVSVAATALNTATRRSSSPLR